jgi:Uma2 family endonuclease
MATQVHELIDAPIAEERRIAMSFDEFMNLPESIHAEWVDGDAIIFMTTTIVHGQIVSFLLRLIGAFAEEFGLGDVLTAPCSMRLQPTGPLREPDVMFVSAANRDRLVGLALEGPADLIVEVLSDDSVVRDRGEKFSEYQEGGVPEYWICDPRPGKESADCYRLGANGKYEPIVPDAQGRIRSSVLPGFWLCLNWLRSDPLPLVKAVLAEILADPTNPCQEDDRRIDRLTVERPRHVAKRRPDSSHRRRSRSIRRRSHDAVQAPRRAPRSPGGSGRGGHRP